MATFAAARERVRNLPFQTPDLGERLSHRSLNNAVLATHSTYYGAETLFDGAYRRLGSDLRRLIRFVHDEVAPARDPSAYLARWNETHPVASADCVGAHCTTDSELAASVGASEAKVDLARKTNRRYDRKRWRIREACDSSRHSEAALYPCGVWGDY